MSDALAAPDPRQIHRLRLNTLIWLRWLAIAGQSAAVLWSHSCSNSRCRWAVFRADRAVGRLNLYLSFRYPATYRLPPPSALGILTFDALQLGGLLYMTGGLTNPFSLLMTVPVVISATSLPLRLTLLLGLLVVAMATFLAIFHLPLPWFPGTQLSMPAIYIAGMWMAIVSALLHRRLCLSRRRGGAVAGNGAFGDRTGAAARAAPVRARRAGRRGRARARAPRWPPSLSSPGEMERALGDDPRFART
jgi:two-component system, sensor histidine kinase RegB